MAIKLTTHITATEETPVDWMIDQPAPLPGIMDFYNENSIFTERSANANELIYLHIFPDVETYTKYTLEKPNYINILENTKWWELRHLNVNITIEII
jgi:hypothetical protein